MLLIISEYKIKFAATCRPCNDMVHELWVRLMGRYLPVEVKHLESPSVVGDPIWTRGREAVIFPYGNGLKNGQLYIKTAERSPEFPHASCLVSETTKATLMTQHISAYLSLCLCLCILVVFVCLSVHLLVLSVCLAVYLSLGLHTLWEHDSSIDNIS